MLYFDDAYPETTSSNYYHRLRRNSLLSRYYSKVIEWMKGYELNEEGEWELTEAIKWGAWRGYFWCFPPTLRHVGNGCYPGHPSEAETPFYRGKWAYLWGTHWTHVAFTWNERADEIPDLSSTFSDSTFITFEVSEEKPDLVMHLWINGKILPERWYTLLGEKTHLCSGSYLCGGDSARFHEIIPLIPLEIGGMPSRVIDNLSEYPAFPADSTLDEFYLWKDNAARRWYETVTKGKKEEQVEVENPIKECIKTDLWGKGRYYQGNDGVFYSGEIDIAKLSKGDVTILGASWTAYDQDIFNYDTLQFTGGEVDWSPPRWYARVYLYFQIPEGEIWQDINPLPMQKANWTWIYKIIPGKIRYRIEFFIDKDQLGNQFDDISSILLESPIFDEIKIYYTLGRPVYMQWILV
jgi:hypothetical protein